MVGNSGLNPASNGAGFSYLFFSWGVVGMKNGVYLWGQTNTHNMNTADKNFTGQYIKYPNGNVMSIYSQMTKKGIRRYRYFRGRFQIISEAEINEFAYIVQ